MDAEQVFAIVVSTKKKLQQEIDDAIVGVYTYGGSVAFEDLPALSLDKVGFVYKITDDFTTTSDFIEGAGTSYPAGTGVAIANRGDSENPILKYDAKTGIIVVDNELSTTSENPAQNKVITLKFNELVADILTRLQKVSAMPQNPSNNDLVVWHGSNAYKVGHIYKYVEGTGETLYAWQVDNPGGVGDGTVIYTKSAIPNEDTNIYKSDGTAYSSSTDDPTYELMVGGESAITIEIFSLSQMQSWERSALRKSSDDIVATSGEWVEVTKDNVQDDWEQSDSSAPDYIKNKPTLGTAASRNATNQITEGSTALPEAGAVKTALDGKISTSNTPGHVMNDGTIDQTEYEESGVAETLVKDTVGWSGKNLLSINKDTCFYRSGTFTKVSDNSFTITRMAFGASNIVNVIHPVEHNTDYVFDFVGTEGIYKYGMKFVSEMPAQWQNLSNMVKSGNSGSNNYVVIGFEISAGETTQVETVSNLQLEHGLISTSFEPYHATVDTVKADKVTNATSGHFAGLDANGNLTDSGHSDVNYVHKTGNEDIAGNKHFTGDVIVDGNIIGKKGTIYGFHIDNTEDDPDEKVTYLLDAIGMKPAKMNFVTGKFDYGSWENAFFMPRPCMLKFDGTVDYYLDPNDYSKKEDGTASDVADLTCDANAMMEWGRDGKKIWVKIEPTSSDKKSANILIADYQVDPNYKAWSFINNQGDLVDHFYTAIYKGSLDSNNRMRSISGQDYTNYVNNKTRAEEIALAEANNPSTDKLWYTEVRADNQLINFLTILMFKSTDIQAKLGEGRTGFSWAQSNVATTGIMDDKGMFYGESSSTGLGCKLFGREQPYGDVWMAEAGTINASGVPKNKMTYGTQDGSTAVGYNTDGTGYLADSNTYPGVSGTCITEMVFDPVVGMIPIKADATRDDVDYCDGLWTNNSQTNYALRGGLLIDGRLCGAFYLTLYNVPGVRHWPFGAALSCKPLA